MKDQALVIIPLVVTLGAVIIIAITLTFLARWALGL